MATCNKSRRFHKTGSKATVLSFAALCLLAMPGFAADAGKEQNDRAIDRELTTGSVTAPKLHKDAISKKLLRALLKAQTQTEGTKLERRLVNHWRTAPNDEAKALFRAGAHASRLGDFLTAVVIFDVLEQKAPKWPEVYSQRAFLKYRMGQHDEALVDVNKALKLQPNRFVALSGKFNILVAKSKPKEARDALELAVAIHPFLKERRLLGKQSKEMTQL